MNILQLLKFSILLFGHGTTINETVRYTILCVLEGVIYRGLFNTMGSGTTSTYLLVDDRVTTQALDGMLAHVSSSQSGSS
jgi:hypothetical protein